MDSKWSLNEEMVKIMTHLHKFREVKRSIHLMDGRENDEEHTGAMCLLITVLRPFLEDEWDVRWDLVYELASIHDVPEIISGDVHYLADKTGKKEREIAAITTIFRKMPNIRSKWKMYEERESQEAILVKQIDILQCVGRIVLSGGMTWRINRITKEIEMGFSRWIWEKDNTIGNLLRHLFEIAEKEDMFWKETSPKRYNETSILSGKEIILTPKETEAVSDFHRSRLAFAIREIGGNVELLVNIRDEREHRIYLQEDHGVGLEEFENMVRGYIKPGKIRFFRGTGFHPIKDWEIDIFIDTIKELAKEEFGQGTYEVGNGVSIGKLGEEWPPISIYKTVQI